MPHDNRWSIYIDIEGFGALYDKEDKILSALCDLMEGIYLIGKNYYPESPNRIFANQIGDGFVITGEFGANNYEVPIAISIALLRHVSMSGRFAKATISNGGLTGINGWYPKLIRDAQNENGYVMMGGGVMTIFPVMGTGLINAVATQKRSPSGALLIIDMSLEAMIPTDCLVHSITDRKLVSIDWIHSTLSLAEKIQNTSGLRTSSPQDLTDAFTKYFRTTEVKNEWKANSNWYLSLGLSPNI